MAIHRRSNSGLLIARAALLCCAFALVASTVLGQVALQPAGEHSAGSAPPGKPKKVQDARQLDTTSLEKTIRDAVREAGEKHDPHAVDHAKAEGHLVEYTRQLAVETDRLAKFTLWLVGATGVLAFIAIWQLGMFWLQLKVMKRGVEDARTVAEAARASAESALLQLRPWLSCDIELGEPLTFNAEGDAVFAFHFIVKNVGHLPAMAIQFSPSISLFEFHNRSMAHLKKMADWNRDFAVNAATVLIPGGFSMGPLDTGPIIFPGGSKTFNYRMSIKRADLEKSCENIKPNTNFSPEVFAIIFYTYPSAKVRATTAVGRMILKIGGAIEMDKPLSLDELRLEDFSSDFAT